MSAFLAFVMLFSLPTAEPAPVISDQSSPEAIRSWFLQNSGIQAESEITFEKLELAGTLDQTGGVVLVKATLPEESYWRLRTHPFFNWWSSGSLPADVDKEVIIGALDSANIPSSLFPPKGDRVDYIYINRADIRRLYVLKHGEKKSTLWYIYVNF